MVQNRKALTLVPYNLTEQELKKKNHLGGGPVVRAWDQEVCSLCGLRFKPCGCSYDGCCYPIFDPYFDKFSNTK